MEKLLKDKLGNTLYPTCSWSENQHKLYNAHDKAYLNEDYEAIEHIEYLLGIFNAHVHNNIVYAPYNASIQIKELITAYDYKTDYLETLHKNKGDA